ncbi:MAG: anthranilate phosphoribosyltransferase [Actinobacteria bacterium]|nr:anthranilate phosphoribosyltransferase [Actinomycetota bacterium]
MTETTFDEAGGWSGVLATLTGGDDLTGDVARSTMAEVLAGNASPAQIAAFMVALRMKGETVEELGGLVDAMLDVAAVVPLEDPDAAVDVVGTGGDRAHTINVSTIAAFVVAGAGAKVCKHGNRAASSSCGTADVLEALGVAIDLDAQGVARCVEEAGMGFCFAPRFHPAFRHAGPPRRELGIATAFNVLGPLTNPGRVRRHLIGLADASMAERMLRVLAARGSRRAMVVHGDDGLDELTTTTTSTITELRDGTISTWTLDPAAFGIGPASPDDLRGADATANAESTRAVLAGRPGHHRDIVLLNAAAALVVAGLADDLSSGFALAGRVLDDGAAAMVLERLVTVSNEVARVA